MKNHASDPAIGEQVIRVGEVYSLKEALARLGWGRDAYDSARKQGLKSIKRVGRVYLSGRSLIQFLEGESSSAE